MRVVRRGKTYLMYITPEEMGEYMSLNNFWPVIYYQGLSKKRPYPNELGAVFGQNGRWNRIILDSDR